jgi:endonuclease/exonuclease/phosphatase family metal-dependent hydrolase
MPAPSFAIRWIAPSAERDRELLDTECRRIGAPILLAGASAPLRPDNLLTVVSWNVHAGEADVTGMVAALRRGDLTDGREVRQFALLLQEAARDTSARDDAANIDTIAQQLQVDAVYVPGMQNGARGRDRGVAILASSSFDEVTVVELPFERQRRVAVAVTLKCADGTPPVRLVSVHLDIGMMATRGGGEVARRRQAEALRDALGPPPARAIVAGDFNTAWGDAEGLLDALEKTYPDAMESGEMSWRGPMGLRRRLDHMFVKADGVRVRVRVVSDRFGSDHHPLIAELPLS